MYKMNKKELKFILQEGEGLSIEFKESLKNIDKDIISDKLMKREKESSTVLSPTLAIPHIIIEGEKKFSILLARCRKGIEFSKPQSPVYAVFVLIGSKDERQFHLRALSSIAQIVMDPRFEKKWMRARSRKALRDVIISADRKREI